MDMMSNPANYWFCPPLELQQDVNATGWILLFEPDECKIQSNPKNFGAKCFAITSSF